MTDFKVRQCTLTRTLEFSGIGVHNGRPSVLSIAPGAPDSGYLLSRRREDGTQTEPVRITVDRVTHTSLCTVIDLGQSVRISTVEHVLSALSGVGIDNALIVVDGDEFPILDGSATQFVAAIFESGIAVLPQLRSYIRILRTVTVRDNDAFALLEPHNGRTYDVEIDFDNDIIGRQRMIFDWSPRRYAEQVAQARTFGFVAQAKVLRQAGYALGSSLENSIAIDDGAILNPGGLRYRDEFVRHKLLDAMGDLAIAGKPIYGRFRSYKGGHALNAMVLQSLFASASNYEIVEADALPLELVTQNDWPEDLVAKPYLRSIG